MTFLHFMCTSAHIAFDAQAHDQPSSAALRQLSLSFSQPNRKLVMSLLQLFSFFLTPIPDAPFTHITADSQLDLGIPTTLVQGEKVSQGGGKCCSKDNTSALTAVLQSQDTLSNEQHLLS